MYSVARNVKLNDFFKFLFNGFEVECAHNDFSWSTKYREIFFKNNISEDGEKVMVRIPVESCFKTRYGYGIRLTSSKVIWVKGWQVSRGASYGEWKTVVLTRKSFKVQKSEWKNEDDIQMWQEKKVRFTDGKEWEGLKRLANTQEHPSWVMYDY